MFASVLMGMKPLQMHPTPQSSDSPAPSIPLTLSLGYLGPEGSHSSQAAHYLLTWLAHQAALTQKPDAPENIYRLQERPTLERLMADCEAGLLDWAVLPVENILEGSVIEVISQMGLQQKRLIPLLEFSVAIQHCLMLPPGGRLDKVTTVLSHPQAIGQCRQRLVTHLGANVTWEWTKSTADAARRLSQATPDENLAAIGSQAAARAFGLTIALADISDHPDNQTRFWLVRGANTHGKVHDFLRTLTENHPKKTSLCLAMRDRSGVLADVLTHFKNAAINLTKIESRPSRQNLGQYHFHLDAEGDLSEASSLPLLDLLAQDTVYLYQLGVYPVVGRLG
ncbi:MAG: prephenate dehydratase domain-containing protein [Vampirovibrionales bacterium]|nr:prephenate dehydratase domain-containing protein [Vampirovibrionales bacterium]